MTAIRERLAEVERAIQDRTGGTQEPSQLEQFGRTGDPLRRRLYDDDWAWIDERQSVSGGHRERFLKERPAVRTTTGISIVGVGSTEPTMALSIKKRTPGRTTRDYVSDESEQSDGQTMCTSKQRKPHTTVRLSSFDGSTPLETFVAKFNNCAEYYRWNKRDRLFHLKACLEGPAGQLL